MMAFSPATNNSFRKMLGLTEAEYKEMKLIKDCDIVGPNAKALIDVFLLLQAPN